MKKTISILLVLLLFAGCVPENVPGEVTFFYPRLDYTYNTSDSVIASEERDSEGYISTVYLLGIYLAGPLEETLTNPFPKGLEVLSAYTDSHTVYITVSDQMATLSGASLILACACLGKTGIGLTGTETAVIRCESLLLDGKSSITVSGDTILYTDGYTADESD